MAPLRYVAKFDPFKFCHLATLVVVPMRGLVGSRLGGLKSVTDYQTGRLVVWLRGVKEKGRDNNGKRQSSN